MHKRKKNYISFNSSLGLPWYVLQEGHERSEYIKS